MESVNASYLILSLSIYANMVLMLYNAFVSLLLLFFNTGMVVGHLYLADHHGVSESARLQYEGN